MKITKLGINYSPSKDDMGLSGSGLTWLELACFVVVAAGCVAVVVAALV